MAQQDNTVDVFWTSHSDSSKVGSVESLPTGEAQAAVSTGLARVATSGDKRSAGAKQAAETRKPTSGAKSTKGKPTGSAPAPKQSTAVAPPAGE